MVDKMPFLNNNIKFIQNELTKRKVIDLVIVMIDNRFKLLLILY